MAAAATPTPEPIDPSKRPKRTRTAFAYYVQQNFRKVRWEKRPISVNDVMKELANMWKKEDADDREEFKDMQDEDRDRYRTARSKWLLLFPGQRAWRKHQKKASDAPKRNLNSFFHFQRSVWQKTRIERPELDQTTVVRKIAKQWRNMTKAQRAPFKEQAEEDKRRYVREKAIYRRQVADRITKRRFERLMEQIELRRLKAETRNLEPVAMADHLDPVEAIVW